MKSELERNEQSWFDKPLDENYRRATQLLNAVMSYARLILKQYGELGPFGFAIDREGQVARETVELPRLPRDPERLWKLLAEHMKEQVRRGRVKALAMAANVTLAQPSEEGFVDAVVMEVEQETGSAMEITVPYRIYGGHLKNLIPRRIDVGKVQVEERDCRIFGVK
ncbi:MAG TPA: hypothetical protein VHX13_00140 [Acidobacteriaceae bacterium]|jgi:hypothetical protein|nr:hypothetical protein [Acidobacteriaceae bacterium]